MADIIKVTDRISYIKATEKPLSADVGIIEGDEFCWIFDVGADESVPISLNKIQKPKKSKRRNSLERLILLFIFFIISEN